MTLSKKGKERVENTAIFSIIQVSHSFVRHLSKQTLIYLQRSMRKAWSNQTYLSGDVEAEVFGLLVFHTVPHIHLLSHYLRGLPNSDYYYYFNLWDYQD